MTAAVYIVHCVDTEGPLYEPLAAKFGRLKYLFGLEGIAPTADNLRKLRAGEISLAGKEQDVQRVLGGHLANFMKTWTEIDAMLDRVMAPVFRNSRADSFGGGWIYNWFCLDHVGFDYNPNRRDIGFHNIFDHYRERVAGDPYCPDVIQWHFHPMSTYRDAHRCATHYFRSPEVFEILSRKIIERNFFPHVFRAGFQTERPDSHWFLEQWMPFDISNMAIEDISEFDRVIDFRNGRSGDWRRAPADWSVYHPSHDDYQVPGACRRAIGRCLNVLNRLASLDQREMDKAFARAQSGLPTLVGVASHDYRDLGTEVEFLRDLIAESRRRYPDVPVRFSTAREAFRGVLWPDGIHAPALDFDLVFHPATADDVATIEVVVRRGNVFGPQPFLAIKTRARVFLHDNFDFDVAPGRWFYAFHGDTLPIEDVSELGVAASDLFGNVCIRRLSFSSGPLHATSI